MATAHLSKSIELSPQFFTIVFADAFIFCKNPRDTLKETQLNAEEKKLALQIHKSVIDGPTVWDECAEICEQLSDLYRWQDNSEGPIIFAQKVLYLLRFKGEDVEWFKQQVQNARALVAASNKKMRATVIVPTNEGILLARDHKGMLLLPGGNLKRGELPIAAAARELHEETGLKAQALEFLFEEESDFYLHQVFLVQRYTEVPVARSDALELLYLNRTACAQGQFPEKLYKSHERILQKLARSSPVGRSWPGRTRTGFGTS